MCCTLCVGVRIRLACVRASCIQLACLCSSALRVSWIFCLVRVPTARAALRTSISWGAPFCSCWAQGSNAFWMMGILPREFRRLAAQRPGTGRQLRSAKRQRTSGCAKARWIVKDQFHVGLGAPSGWHSGAMATGRLSERRALGSLCVCVFGRRQWNEK